MAEDEEGAFPGYLQRMKNVLQDLESLDFKLHVEQCEFLRRKLTKFVDTISFLNIGDDGCSTSFAPAIGEEILNVIKRAKWLMEECCNEHWLRKAMEVSACGEIGEILCSLADLLPYAFSAELGIDASQCDNQFLDTMKDLASKHMPYVLSARLGIDPSQLDNQFQDAMKDLASIEVELELIKRSRNDRMVLVSKVERILGKLEVSELAPDVANMGENTGLAHLVRDMYTTSVISLNWLPPEISSNINFDSLDVRGARVYTTIQCLGGEYSLLTLNLHCGSISEGLIKDLCQEATVWKKYQHPHIVHLMGYWETNPRPYLLYESMDFNLETLITKVRAVRELMPLEAIEMMLPVARAIKFMHGHGVAHRGLNTENIMCIVGQEDFSMPLHDVTLKLMGFGDALEGASSSVQERIWEPASISVFTAPEILLQNNTSIDFLKGDVFSFGMVLLKVLTGQTDFDYLALGGEGPSILQFRLERLNFAGSIPTSLGSIIESSCHADPNMRPAFEDICSRLLLCKLQLLSQKNADISQKNADVGSVQAGKIWRLHNIVVPLQALRNWQVLERKKCLPLLAFLAILVAMVSSIVLQSSAVDRALVWISNRIEFICTLIICVCLCFCAFYFILRIGSNKMLMSELKAQDTSSKQSFQGHSLSKNGQGSFDRLELLMEFIQMMPQLPCLTDIEIVQVMTKAPSDTNKLKCLRTTILQSQFWINMPDSFQIMNIHQCQYLCAKISTMLTNLEDQVNDLPILNYAFKELLGVLDMAKLLVDGCQNFKLLPKAIVLVHCEEYFVEVFSKLHLWMEVVKALQMWKVKDYGGEPLESYMPLLHASEMAMEIIALNEAAAKDHNLNIDVLNNYEMSGLDLIELNMVSYLRKILSQVGVVHKLWRPSSFKKDIVLDLTEDLLGVSPTGWVIKTKWAGGYYTLKRVNDAKQFGMQALVLASLWHPHIVQLFNYWEEKGKFFMLMEYMESGDLANFIAKKETLPLPVVIDILLQFARGVYYLHNKGIAHNDLKCPNILMTLDPSREGYYIVKLGGFGSAKRVLHNPNVFVQDIYNFGLTCDVIVTQLLSDEYESRFFKLQKIYDSTIQYLRLCIKMCQSEDPLLRPNCAKILRLLSLAQLQSMGIIIHTNEFYCLCNMKAFNILNEPVKVSKEETMQRSLKELPESIGELKYLTELNLEGCESLKKLPKSISKLKSLTYFNLHGCGSSEELPESIGKLKSLMHLILWECGSLKELPESIGELKSLTKLNLVKCGSLKELPESIGELKYLTELNLGGCESLKKLPKSISKLKSLTYFNLHGCGSLEELLESIGKLKSLMHLILWECGSLKELPESIGELKSLTKLNLGGCESLKELPKSIGKLKSLTELDLGGCESLKRLPESIGELKSLTYFNLHGCGSLEELPESIGKLKSLTELDLGGCGSLKELPESIGELKYLTELNLGGCGSLKELPESIGELKYLTELNLLKCGSLKELSENIGELKYLTELNVGGCGSLKELPESIGELKSLTKLNLLKCGSLRELTESIGELKSLTELNLGGCESLKELPESIGELKSLTKLNLLKCGSLKELPESIGELKSLTVLNLGGCESLNGLPKSIGELKSLTELNLGGCQSLKELPESIGELKSLMHLILWGCGSLKELPESIGELKSLTELNLGRCESLKELPESIGELKSLTKLNLLKCRSLKGLPESIGELKSLRYFNLHGCGSWKSFQKASGSSSLLRSWI